MPIAEICCGSYLDAITAFRANASRIELNSALELGGLTPSLTTLQLVKQHTTLEVIAMVRPRGGGFVYSEQELQVMMLETEQLLEYHADGIAFGILNNRIEVNKEATKQMVECIHRYGKEAVFHRAFDQVRDPYLAMEALIDCGVDRVLTSGLRQSAMEGCDLLKSLQEKYGHAITVLAGSGINHLNCQALMSHTKIKEVHSSCKAYVIDESTVGNISYAMLPSPHELCYASVDLSLAQQFVIAVK